MTEAEAAAYEKKRQLQEESQAKDDIHYDNVIWQKESYDKVVTRRRTSIVVDPPDSTRWSWMSRSVMARS